MSNAKCFLFCVAISFIPIISNATVINVPADVTTIQAGIDTSVPGDTVLVAPGRYYENINFRGKDILVASNYILNYDTAYISGTIIDGSTPEHPDTGSCVLFVSGESREATLRGFTLTGGVGTIWPDTHGGGNYREGGGVIIELSSPSIKDNWIIDNRAIDIANARSAGGGGIRCSDGDPLIEDNIILSNIGRYGAGMVMYFSDGTIRNNVIAQNIGGEDYGGGGIWFSGEGSAILEYNTIAHNISSRWGGGISVADDASVDANHNIFWENEAANYPNYGPQIYVDGGSVESYCNDIDGPWYGTDVINVDPIFCNPEMGDYALDFLSPCLGDHPLNLCGENIGALGPSCRNCDDSDEDGFCAVLDNCPDRSNPGQEDVDNDKIGDACDNCINTRNYNQEDGDYDDVGDACDNCPNDYNPTQYDPDLDRVGSICDNCPDLYNPYQEDSDGDNIGDLCDYLCGDANADLGIDLIDIVFLINYLYKSYPPPFPLGRGDVNSDKLVNILDIIYLINTLFKNGPEPTCQL